MKKLSIVCILILTMAFVLAGCTNEKDGASVPTPDAAANSNVDPDKNEVSANQPADGFQASEDSTWGDLLRYFDPEGFEALPEEDQEELDHTLLTEQSPQIVIKEDGKWVFRIE